VIDAGVSGWGFTQAYLAIGDLLGTKPSPSVFVYQMIPDDIYRSYLRAPVTTGVTRRLEFVDGRLEMRDAPKTSPEITPALVDREIRLAADLILGMHRMCDQHHVPFKRCRPSPNRRRDRCIGDSAVGGRRRSVDRPTSSTSSSSLRRRHPTRHGRSRDDGVDSSP
jgi:hypothetical protein